MFMDCVTRLCNAIVAQAADDYREQSRDFLLTPAENKVNYLLLNRRYFETDCCGMTTIGKYIVERIESEEREELPKEYLAVADALLRGCGQVSGAA